MSWTMPLLMVCLGVPFFVLARRRPSEQAILQVCRRVDLPPVPVALERIAVNLRRRNTATAVGALVAAVLTSAAILASPSASAAGVDTPLFSTGQPQLWSAIFITCLIGARALAALAPLSMVRSDAPRLARATRPRIPDYIGPTRLWLTRIIVLAAVAGGVTALMVQHPTAPALIVTASVVAAAVAVGLLAAVEGLGRRLLSVAQPAEFSVELAWDDALRAWAVTDLWLVPLAFGIDALAFAVAVAGGSTLAAFLAIMVNFIPLMLSVNNPGRHYKRRLWPNLHDDSPAQPRHPDPGWQA